jgi:hypothetical protein
MQTPVYKLKSLMRHAVVLSVILAVSGLALGAETVAPNLTGAWFAKIKGGDEKEVANLVMTQSGSSGTFYGTVIQVKSENEFDIEGTYEMDGRLLTGTLTVIETGDTFYFGGKCNKKGKKAKLKFLDMIGKTIKFKMKRVSF